MKIVYQLSGAQKGLLFHSMTSKRAGVYSIQTIIRLHHPLNVSWFEQAWQQVLNRHHILRAALKFGHFDDAALEIQPDVRAKIAIFDYSSLTAAEQQEQLREFIDKDRNTGFDYSIAPLMRFKLIKFASDEYVFVWTQHHLLMSGVSASRVLREVFAIYDSRVDEAELTLPSVSDIHDHSPQFIDSNVSDSKNYWRTLLKGFQQPTELAIPATNTKELQLQQQHSITLSANITKNLKHFAHHNAMTLNILIQGAWGLLLQKYSLHDDIVFGVVRAYPANQIKNAIGLFINTLPVRAECNYANSLNDYLANIREQNKKLSKHIFSSLKDIQGWSELAAGVELFNTIVDFKPYSPVAEAKSLGRAWLKREPEFWSQTHYPLVLEGYEELGRLGFRFNYDPGKYDAEIIQRMARHFKNILYSFVDVNTQQLKDINYFAPDELETILNSWNSNSVDYPLTQQSVVQLFEQQVEQLPQQIAISCDQRTISYQQLNQDANKVAAKLIAAGIKPRQVVAICLPRSIEMVVAILAAVKVDAIYLPMDPDYPQQRIQYMLKNAGVATLLTQKNLQKTYIAADGNLLPTIFIEQMLEADDKLYTNPNVPLNADDTIYAIYTSGSTGRPKGVLISNKSLLNLVYWHQHTYQVTAADQASVLSGEGFDASVWELWPYLTAGATLHIVPKNNGNDLAWLLDWMQRNKITMSFMPTPMWEAAQQKVLDGQFFFRHVLTGGDRLRHYPLTEPSFGLHNHYGPTENSVVAASAPVHAVDANINPGHLPLIGKPIANVEIYILDHNLHAVPMGVIGELFIGGVGLASGYLNSLEEQERHFLDHPWKNDKAKLYRTGDLARWLPDGTIDYIGRVDDQVQIRGFRIELAEIYSELSHYPKIKQAVILPNKDALGGSYLTAYIVPKDQADFNVNELRQQLLEFLPHYMVPEEFVLLPSMPLTANGKINKTALLKNSANDSATLVAPEGRYEKQILAIFQELLQHDTIDVGRNLFELGVHSFMVLEACNRINAELGVELQPVDLFTYSTIRALAGFLQKSGADKDIFAAIQSRLNRKKSQLARKKKVK